MVPFSFGCGSAVLAAIATLAPSRAARSAMARPMPRLAPEMNRVLPFSDVMARAPLVRSIASLPGCFRAAGARIRRAKQPARGHQNGIRRGRAHRLNQFVPLGAQFG